MARRCGMKHRNLGSPGWSLVFLLGPMLVGIALAVALGLLKVLFP